MSFELYDVLNTSYEFSKRLCFYLNRDEICNLIEAVFLPVSADGWWLCTRHGAFFQIARKYIENSTTPTTMDMYFRPSGFEYCETSQTFFVSVAEVYRKSRLFLLNKRVVLSRAQAEKLARGALETNFTYGFTKSGLVYDDIDASAYQPRDLCVHLNSLYIDNFTYYFYFCLYFLFIIVFTTRHLTQKQDTVRSQRSCWRT